MPFVCIHLHHGSQSVHVARTQIARTRRSGDATEADKLRGKVTITLCLDAERVAQLQALAEAENRSLTDYVETAKLRDLSRREGAERVITMYVAPGVADSIRPKDVIRAEGESDEDCAERQTLTQLAQLGGGIANFAGSGANPINRLSAVSRRIGRVVATKVIPFCRRV